MVKVINHGVDVMGDNVVQTLRWIHLVSSNGLLHNVTNDFASVTDEGLFEAGNSSLDS